MNTLSARYVPKTQAECDLAEASHEFDVAHKVWMNTAVHTAEGQRARASKDAAREKYVAAYKAVYPKHIVM